MLSIIFGDVFHFSLDAYFKHREHLAEQWRERARVRGEAVASWSRWPGGHLFLGQRGPLAERGIREIIAKLGQAAKLSSPLGPETSSLKTGSPDLLMKNARSCTAG